MMITTAFRVWTRPLIIQKLNYSEKNGGTVPKRQLSENVTGHQYLVWIGKKLPTRAWAVQRAQQQPAIAGSRPSETELTTPDTLQAAASSGCDVTINSSNKHSSRHTAAPLVTQRGGHGQRRDSGLSACRAGRQLSCSHGL